MRLTRFLWVKSNEIDFYILINALKIWWIHSWIENFYIFLIFDISKTSPKLASSRKIMCSIIFVESQNHIVNLDILWPNKKPRHAIPSKYKTHVLSCIWNMHKQDVLRRLEESLWNVSEALWCILWMSFSRKRKAYAYFISSGRNKVYTQHWCYKGTKTNAT